MGSIRNLRSAGFLLDPDDDPLSSRPITDGGFMGRFDEIRETLDSPFRKSSLVCQRTRTPSASRYADTSP